MKRREFLGQCLASAWLGTAGATGCRRRPPSRGEVLAALVKNVAVPSARSALSTSEQLGTAVAAFGAAPSPSTLEIARQAWRSALLAWKRAQCFQNGPIVETNALVRTTFWPARPAAIETALAAPAAIDDAFVADLGVDARGFYALEYLLFPLDVDAARLSERFAREAGGRRRALAVGLARSITRYSGTVVKALGDGEAFGARFAEGGQESLSRLVNQMIGTVENLSAHRLGLVFGLEENHLLRPSEVEGWFSSTSHELALAQITGIDELYRGGLSELASAAAPALEARVRQRFAEALSAVRALKAPLERLVSSNRPALSAATGSTKALELAIKVDLASALGVTITFQAGDGD